MYSVVEKQINCETLHVLCESHCVFGIFNILAQNAPNKIQKTRNIKNYDKYNSYTFLHRRPVCTASRNTSPALGLYLSILRILKL